MHAKIRPGRCPSSSEPNRCCPESRPRVTRIRTLPKRALFSIKLVTEAVSAAPCEAGTCSGARSRSHDRPCRDTSDDDDPARRRGEGTGDGAAVPGAPVMTPTDHRGRSAQATSLQQAFDLPAVPQVAVRSRARSLNETDSTDQAPSPQQRLRMQRRERVTSSSTNGARERSSKTIRPRARSSLLRQ